jgi:hypothetical protein
MQARIAEWAPKRNWIDGVRLGPGNVLLRGSVARS